MTEEPALDLRRLRQESSLAVDYPESFVTLGRNYLWLERVGAETRLAVLTPSDASSQDGFHGSRAGEVLRQYSLRLCPRDAENAAHLREVIPSLSPVPLGLSTSAGFGDRLGLATPGHIHALRLVTEPGTQSPVAPIFAQQSIREMDRTGRSARGVLDDATWGAFQAGWNEPVGADADHLKTPDDIDRTAECGYSLYTIDPGAFVDDAADTAEPAAIRQSLEDLPWQDLAIDLPDLTRRYAGRRLELDDRTVTIDDEVLARAAVKYGAAIAHVGRMYRYLHSKGIPFELEVSVDETETPTSQVEHAYIASELTRLGVRWISLAPRFVGSFEKGVDYIGDLDVLRADLEGHAAIARSFGPYKLSLHSGSDKFMVYPLIQEATMGLVHLKTAGTSYLEALRVVAQVDPALFRAILSFARDHYERDRATYHVSGRVSAVPDPASLRDEELECLLDDFDARQVLHVTFGSALGVFRSRLMALLRTHEDAYAGALERHFVRHLAPFAVTTQVASVNPI